MAQNTDTAEAPSVPIETTQNYLQQKQHIILEPQTSAGSLLHSSDNFISMTLFTSIAPVSKTYTTLMPVETQLPQTSNAELPYLIEIVPEEQMNRQSTQALFDERDLLNDLNNYDLDQDTRDLINLLVRTKLTITYKILFHHLNVQTCIILF